MILDLKSKLEKMNIKHTTNFKEKLPKLNTSRPNSQKTLKYDDLWQQPHYANYAFAYPL